MFAAIAGLTAHGLLRSRTLLPSIVERQGRR
jgi:hypothetical protein